MGTNGIVFTDKGNAAAFADSLETQCQTNIDLVANDEHINLVEETVENLREEEPDDDDELIREINPD